MRIDSNPHTHSNFVDGKNTPAEMAEAAYRLGFVSLGFSEHANQTMDQAFGLTKENERAYIDEVKRLQKAYDGRMRILLGTERDRLSRVSTEGYDYFIGANHYLVSSDGEVAAVDGDADRLEAWVNQYAGGDWYRVAEKYFSEYAEYIEDIRPDIIAHFDLIVKQNRKRHWFDESADAFLRPGFAAMERMIRVCDVMEVNTGGIARSGQPVPYPAPALLSRWHSLGGRVIVSSDCHRAHQLDAWFDRAPDYLREAGFDRALRLGAGEALFEEISL